MSRSILPWGVLLGCCVATPPARGIGPPPKLPADARRVVLEAVGYTRVPLTLDAKMYLYADGTAGGEPVRFFVDGGSQGTAVDRKLAEKLKLGLGREVESVGIAGVVAGREAHLPGLTVGPFAAGKAAVAVADLSAWPGAPVVLGADLLDEWAAVVDYPARALYLRRSGRAPNPGPARPKPPADPLRGLLTKAGYTAVPMDRGPGGLRAVAAAAGTHPLRLMVDTGANVTGLDAAGADKLRAKRFGGGEAKGFGGKAKAERVSFRGLTVGGYDTRRSWQEVYAVTVDLAGMNAGMAAHKRPPVAGMLGGYQLLNGSAVIDLGAGTLYLRPVRDAVAPRLAGRWVGVGYELDGEKHALAPGFMDYEFKGDRFRSTQDGLAVEWAYHLEDLGDRYRIALFKPGADELADGFEYSGAGLIKLAGGKLTMATAQGPGQPVPTDFNAAKGSDVLVAEFERPK